MIPENQGPANRPAKPIRRPVPQNKKEKYGGKINGKVNNS